MKKKASSEPVAIVLAVIIGIIALIVISGGGLTKIYEITKFLGKIPVWTWVLFGFLLLIKSFSKK